MILITTKLKLTQLSPPPSESETTASLDSLSNRLNTLENLSISSRLSSIEANYVTTDTNQTLTGTKTITSNLNLSPSSASSNTGGQINFHYNQNANTTSSIVENASGQIRVNGDLDLNGELRSGLIINGLARLNINNSDISVNRSSSYSVYNAEDTQLCMMQGWQQANDAFRQLNLVCKPSNGEYNSYAAIRLQTNADGTKSEMLYTNPATSDNSTQIATTGFVKSAMSTWSAVTLTPVTTYCSSVGGNYMACYQNPYLKLCTVGFNIRLAAVAIPSATAIVTGFPKALHNFGFSLCNGTISIPVYISTTGGLCLDGAKTLSASTWIDGSVTYPYSSL